MQLDILASDAIPNLEYILKKKLRQLSSKESQITEQTKNKADDSVTFVHYLSFKSQ